MTVSLSQDKLFDRVILSPRHLMWGILALFAVLEFFPVYYSVNTITFFGVCFLGLTWLLAFPKTALLTKANIQPMIFFALWLTYALSSYIWAADRELALDFALLIFRYMATFLLFDAVFRDRRILDKAHIFFVAILVLYTMTALWEMLTWQHLPSSRLYGSNLFIPTGPFFNQNNLAAFMLFILPFVLFLPKLYTKLWIKIFSAAISILFLIIITIQGARIAMLTAAAVLAVIFLFYCSLKTRISLLLLFALLGFAAVRIAPAQIELGKNLALYELQSISSEAEAVRMSSVKIRTQLFKETFDLVAASGFMGVGGGNIEHHLDTDRAYRTAGIINAHNWLLELLGNFGIFIFLGFVYIYLWWVYLLWHRYRKASGRQRYLYLSYLLTLIMFMASSALPSSIRWNHHIWIVFAAINAICHQPQPLLKEPA